MSKRKITALVAALLGSLLLVGTALAMSSDNYRLDWFIPLTGGGGGPVSSTSYAANFTVGQTAICASSSASYGGCLGYWCGTAAEYKIYLPMVLRNFS